MNVEQIEMESQIPCDNLGDLERPLDDGYGGSASPEPPTDILAKGDTSDGVETTVLAEGSAGPSTSTPKPSTSKASRKKAGGPSEKVKSRVSRNRRKFCMSEGDVRTFILAYARKGTIWNKQAIYRVMHFYEKVLFLMYLFIFTIISYPYQMFHASMLKTLFSAANNNRKSINKRDLATILGVNNLDYEGLY